MKPSYTFIDHTADILFEAQAPTLNQLFEQCALAVEDTQVDIKLIEPEIIKNISLKNKSVEGLLFDFLEELIYLKDAELLIFSRFLVKIAEKNHEFLLTAQAQGEKLNREKQGQKVDVKAVTMHLFEVKKVTAGWQAKVLLDI